jgi:ribonuclease HI
MKWYAVVSGKKPGIYNSWSETQENVMGFSGAIFKSFDTKKEAEDFFNVSSGGKKKKEKKLPLAFKTTIYTDGSFKKDKCGFGVVIILNSGKKITALGKVPISKDNPSLSRASNNVAELYAIYVALSLIDKGDVLLYTDSQYSIACLTSYIHDWMKNGWEGVANKELIKEIYSKTEGRNIRFEYIEAHVGHEFNEEADALANKGREQEEDLIVRR